MAATGWRGRPAGEGEGEPAFDGTAALAVRSYYGSAAADASQADGDNVYTLPNTASLSDFQLGFSDLVHFTLPEVSTSYFDLEIIGRSAGLSRQDVGSASLPPRRIFDLP